MNDVAKLSARFSSLPTSDKVMFLARVAHMATIAARNSYISTKEYPERNFENPDGPMLRDANNFVHRVTGYMMHVLDSSEMEGQDASVIAMIAEHFEHEKIDHYLTQWLQN
jgi:hypothetical protein